MLSENKKNCMEHSDHFETLRMCFLRVMIYSTTIFNLTNVKIHREILQVRGFVLYA